MSSREWYEGAPAVTGDAFLLLLLLLAANMAWVGVGDFDFSRGLVLSFRGD